MKVFAIHREGDDNCKTATLLFVLVMAKVENNSCIMVYVVVQLNRGKTL